MNTVLTVFRKELKSTLRDRKTLMSLGWEVSGEHPRKLED